MLLLQNISGVDMECITPSGKRKIVADKGVLPANLGIKICAFNATVEITQ